MATIVAVVVVIVLVGGVAAAAASFAFIAVTFNRITRLRLPRESNKYREMSMTHLAGKRVTGRSILLPLIHTNTHTDDRHTVSVPTPTVGHH